MSMTPRVARPLVWPDVQDLKRWQSIVSQVVMARDDDADLLRGDNEDDFVRACRHQLFAQQRVLSERQAKWLWDIYGRI